MWIESQLRATINADMLQMASPLILKLSLFLVTAIATHLVMSFGQTLIHYKVSHRRIGGMFFRNHINFHHTHYSAAHLVSSTYLGDEGNVTPYFCIPVFLVVGCSYFMLPLNLFIVMTITLNQIKIQSRRVEATNRRF
jgi:hypothetical protein